MPTENDISPDAREVLKALAVRKNVLLTGPPGTGKSRLLNEARELFRWDKGLTAVFPNDAIPLQPKSSPLPSWFPSPEQTSSRKVFQTVFDQNTKYRDFMRGLVPKVGEAGAFEVTSGTLYRASEHALNQGNASLVIIDEINRGPAVAAFGSALVSLEADKRLLSGGIPTRLTQYFEILGDDGASKEYALPENLYILGAMNEADTSVEPLDVAFLRRFHTHRLRPDYGVLRSHFGLGAPRVLPQQPVTPSDFYEALTQAFSKVNEQILLGRGEAYLLGHGALMHQQAKNDDMASAQEYADTAWATMYAHINEVFFGNTRAISEILRTNTIGNAYTLKEATFAGQTIRRVVGPTRPAPAELYSLLRSIAEG